MNSIAICICTRRREKGVLNLLKSIEKLKIPSDTSIELVVVENDDSNRTEKAITEYANNSSLNIRYYLETRQGISYARNRTVKEAGKCDFCCFVDDDQLVHEDWLIELVRCQADFDSAGAWGQNPAIFSDDVPGYVHEFHLPDTFEYGEPVEKAYTNCLLLKKSWLDKFEGPFDLRLNFTGGEDTHLTSRIVIAGGDIRFNPDAVAFEAIPESRTTKEYIIRRTIRTSNTKYFVDFLLGNYSWWKTVLRLSMRFVWGAVLLLPFYLFGKDNKLRGLLKVLNAYGGFLFVFGRKNKFYK